LEICACGVDVHAHVIPHDFPNYLRGAAPVGRPSMVPADACHRSVIMDGKNYRTVSHKCWSVSRRLALKELDYLKHQPGFAGVEIGSNVLGKVVGHADWLPFFEACAELEMAVFVHALRPAGMDRLIGPPALQQVLAYPSDVGLSAASAITSNLMLRFPRLRLAFSHGGGTLLSLLPRLQQAWGVFPGLADCVQSSPTDQTVMLYFDTLVFDNPTLRHLIQTFGASQLMLGAD
jgi:aminocarboxymuconate-semialdehyde decarboxylase